MRFWSILHRLSPHFPINFTKLPILNRKSTNPILDVVGTPPEMGPITKDPGNERIRFCKKISENLSAQLQKLAENDPFEGRFFWAKKISVRGMN